MKKTFIDRELSIKVKEMRRAVNSYETFLHAEGSLPQGITNESDLANKAYSKKNNYLWDNDEW